MEALFHITAILSQILFYVVPVFLYVWERGRIVRGMLLGWGLMTLYFIIVSLLIVEIVLAYKPEAVVHLPEGNSVVASIMFGWVFGLIFAATAKLIRYFVKERPKARKENQAQ